MNGKYTVKFIDLFAGIGGTRIGFEKAFRKQKRLNQKTLRQN